METKIVPPQLLFSHTEEMALSEIPAFAARAFGPFFAALEASGLEQTGHCLMLSPCIPDHTAKRPLTIAMPVVTGGDVLAPYRIIESAELKCIARIHTGSAASLPPAWMKLTEELEAAGHKFAGEWREVYLDWGDDPQADTNVTELQMGIV